MPYITIGQEKGKDQLLSYLDFGEGKPVVLIHGWPLSHRMWERQIKELTDRGYRVIAYDRRGFGDSYKPFNGYDYDTFADDLKTLLDELSLEDVTLVGFSMGGGEVARYMSRHSGARVSKVVFLSAVTPFLLKGEGNEQGVDASVFEGLKEGVLTDRPAFLDTFGKQFINWKTLGSNLVSQQDLDESWNIATVASPKAVLDCISAFSETDFRSDLSTITVPSLVIHGDSDQILPIEATGRRTHDALPGSQYVVVTGGPHGIPMTHAAEVNEALLDFIA